MVLYIMFYTQFTIYCGLQTKQNTNQTKKLHLTSHRHWPRDHRTLLVVLTVRHNIYFTDDADVNLLKMMNTRGKNGNIKK